MIRFAETGPPYSTEQNGTLVTFYGTELTSHSTEQNCHHIMRSGTVITFYGTELSSHYTEWNCHDILRSGTVIVREGTDTSAGVHITGYK